MQGLKDILSQIAPHLALALNGPFQGTAIRYLMDKAQIKQSELKIDPAILIKGFAENPHNFKAIKQFDVDFAQLMEDEGIDLHRFDQKAASATEAPKTAQFKSPNSGPLIISAIFLTAYFVMLGAIFFVEVSDTINMEMGENSMKSELQILFGVLTAGVGQMLSYWFANSKRSNS